MALETYYTTEQAAQIAHRTQKTIRRWIEAGKLKANKVGRGYLISETALKEVLEGKSE